MTAWDMNNGTTGKKTITLRMDGRTQTSEYPNNTKLGEAVREVAKHAGLTAVNVLEDGSEIGQERSNEELGRFTGSLTIVPKDSGSRNN